MSKSVAGWWRESLPWEKEFQTGPVTAHNTPYMLIETEMMKIEEGEAFCRNVMSCAKIIVLVMTMMIRITVIDDHGDSNDNKLQDEDDD